MFIIYNTKIYYQLIFLSGGSNAKKKNKTKKKSKKGMLRQLVPKKDFTCLQILLWSRHVLRGYADYYELLNFSTRTYPTENQLLLLPNLGLLSIFRILGKQPHIKCNVRLLIYVLDLKPKNLLMSKRRNKNETLKTRVTK